MYDWVVSCGRQWDAFVIKYRIIWCIRHSWFFRMSHYISLMIFIIHDWVILIFGFFFLNHHFQFLMQAYVKARILDENLLKSLETPEDQAQGMLPRFRDWIVKWKFPMMWVPQNGWFVIGNRIKMDDFGGTPTSGSHQIMIKTFELRPSKVGV